MNPLLNFIKQLNRKLGVRHVFMEIGYAADWLYNQYLQTGDTAIISSYRLVYSQNTYRTFWRNLYQYNKGLPDTAKPVIHGVDFERTEAFKLLKKLQLSTAPIPDYLQAALTQI